MLHFHSNNKYFYIVDSYIYANNKNGTVVAIHSKNVHVNAPKSKVVRTLSTLFLVQL